MVVAQVDDSDRRWSVHAHRSCLAGLLVADVPPVLPDRSARVPSDAACGVCGERLPIVGRHPYAVTLIEAGLDHTWFVHAQCVPDSMSSE